ncbi:hypothetical protein KKA69_01490, partial [Patescibacteria group bacterium]|nr:hypothetical protein [Patescibacteria group bacterium]
LGGIEEKVKHIFGEIIRIFFLYVIGLILLVTSAGFLDWVIQQQSQWLTLQGNQLVEAGFSFTAGIANIFLILIFIVIAFSYILKLETFQTKKALPKLIMVALLINFALVFMGILIDVANVFYNTILSGNEGLVTLVSRSLIGGGWDIVETMLRWFIAFAIAALIPFIHTLPLQVGALIGAGAFLLPNMVTWIFQLVLFYLMMGIFFLYVFIFAIRVFIIQILAILSPLAFLCLILPQTEKHWKEWLQHLLQWVFLGVFLLFFLVLGLRLSNLLMPPGGPQPWLIGGWFTGIDKYFIYYFFLFIWMVLALWISKKTMPTLATFIIEQATTWGGRVWTGIGKPLIGATRRQLGETAAKSERFQEWAKKQALAETPELKGWKKLMAPAVLPAYALRRGVGRALGPSLIEAEKAEISKIESEAEKIKTPDLLVSKYLSAATDAERIAYLSAAIKKGEPFKDGILKQVSVEQAVAAASVANRIGAVPEAERIARGFIHKLNEDQLKQIGFKSYEQLTPEKQAEWDTKEYKTITDNLIGEAKGDQIKDFTKGFWESSEAMEAIQKFWGGPQLSRSVDEFGRVFVDDYMSVIKKMKAEEVVTLNPRAALYLSGNAAQDLGFRAPEGLTRAEIRRIIKEMEREERGELTEEERLRKRAREFFGI